MEIAGSNLVLGFASVAWKKKWFIQLENRQYHLKQTQESHIFSFCSKIFCSTVSTGIFSSSMAQAGSAGWKCPTLSQKCQQFRDLMQTILGVNKLDLHAKPPKTSEDFRQWRFCSAPNQAVPLCLHARPLAQALLENGQ